LSLLFFWYLRFDALLILNPAAAPLHRSERSQYLSDWSAGYGIQDAAEFFAQISQTQDIVVATEGFWVMESSLAIYLEQMPGKPLKRIQFIGQPPTIDELDPYLIRLSEEGKAVYLIVNDVRLKSDDHRLQVIASIARPALGPDDPAQHLMIYRILEIKR
jgi:hypothetical protein